MILSDSPVKICTADIYDVYHAEVDVCTLQFRSFGLRQTFFGPIETLVTYEDHTPVLAALSQPGEGRVLVVDGGGSLRIGVLGDRLVAIGARNGWTGVIVNGAVRDTAGIDGMDFGVKALGATARKNWTATTGRRGGSVSFGDISIASGDWIYADRDAVIRCPAELDLSRVVPGGDEVG